MYFLYAKLVDVPPIILLCSNDELDAKNRKKSHKNRQYICLVFLYESFFSLWDDDKFLKMNYKSRKTTIDIHEMHAQMYTCLLNTIQKKYLVKPTTSVCKLCHSYLSS